IDLLEECAEELLNDREAHWIVVYKSHDPEYGYNRTLGGNKPLTDEVRARLSKMRMGAGNPMFGREVSARARALISAAHRGRVAPNRGKSFPRRDNLLITS